MPGLVSGKLLKLAVAEPVRRRSAAGSRSVPACDRSGHSARTRRRSPPRSARASPVQVARRSPYRLKRVADRQRLRRRVAFDRRRQLGQGRRYAPAAGDRAGAVARGGRDHVQAPGPVRVDPGELRGERRGAGGGRARVAVGAGRSRRAPGLVQAAVVERLREDRRARGAPDRSFGQRARGGVLERERDARDRPARVRPASAARINVCPPGPTSSASMSCDSE